MQMRMVSEKNLIALDKQLKDSRELYKEFVALYEERKAVDVYVRGQLFDVVISMATIAELQNDLLFDAGVISRSQAAESEQRFNDLRVSAENLRGS